MCDNKRQSSDIQPTNETTRWFSAKMANLWFLANNLCVARCLIMLVYSMYSNQFISALRRNVCELNGKMLRKQRDKHKKQWGKEKKEARKDFCHFDARKFDFITNAVKRVTIRILMGRLLGLKTSTSSVVSDNEICCQFESPMSTFHIPTHWRHKNIFEGFIEGICEGGSRTSMVTTPI